MSAEPFSGERPTDHYQVVAPPSDEDVMRTIQPHEWKFPMVTERPRLRVIEGGLAHVAIDLPPEPPNEGAMAA